MSKIGTVDIKGIMLGNTEIVKAYLGSDVVYQKELPLPYISDGLVLHLDGADCDGSTWVDRVGGKEFTIHHATVDGKGVVFNTTAYSAAGASYATCSSMHNVSPLVGTIEVCAYRTGIRSSSEQENIVLGGTANKLVYVVNAAGTAVRTSNNTANNAPIAYINGRTIEKFTHSINASRHMYNGKLGTLGAVSKIGRSGNFEIGCRTDGHYAFKGIVYQVRIYNRQLSEEEMLWNQEQDRKRYGITFS